ncbi:MAG: hypothetical protein IPL84_02745 [Chitinophagaceae bacterium]|nr:hypothetical protein [Chitinophagaceae bacterium]
MIKLSINFFKKTGKDSTEKISDDVNTTNSNDCPKPGGKIFTAADMWNIQRHGRSAMPRRWSF